MQNFFNNYLELINSINMTNINNVVMTDKINLNRLNMRHDVFFNKWQIWKDKKVLDIAGYDGRWSFAALKAGASYVTNVEIRKSVVDRGIDTFKKLNVPSNTYEFINEDFVKWKPTSKFDIVICAGFLSHIYDHPTVFSLIRECDPKFLLIDTSVNGYQGKIVIPVKNTNREGNSHFTDTSFVENDGLDLVKTWSGQPSKEYVFDLAKTYDFELVEDFDWLNFIDQEKTQGVEDYWTGKRITSLWKRTEEWRWDRKSFTTN
jgi:hypothetical protein